MSLLLSLVSSITLQSVFLTNLGKLEISPIILTFTPLVIKLLISLFTVVTIRFINADTSILGLSQFSDENVYNVNNIYWDYTGVYGVGDVSGNMYLKTLTLDYDFFDNEFFELSVINDSTIELYHPNSGTVYEFAGRGYIAYYRSSDTEGNIQKRENESKKRKQKTKKVETHGMGSCNRN